MCLHAGAGTEHVAFNNGRTRPFCIAYRYYGVPFHSAHLAAAIDVAFHRAAADVNGRAAILQRVSRICAFAVVCYAFVNNAHHGFRTREFIGHAFSAAIDIAFHRSGTHVHGSIGLHVGQVATAIYVAVNRGAASGPRRDTCQQHCNSGEHCAQDFPACYAIDVFPIHYRISVFNLQSSMFATSRPSCGRGLASHSSSFCRKER